MFTLVRKTKPSSVKLASAGASNSTPPPPPDFFFDVLRSPDVGELVNFSWLAQPLPPSGCGRTGLSWKARRKSSLASARGRLPALLLSELAHTRRKSSLSCAADRSDCLLGRKMGTYRCISKKNRGQSQERRAPLCPARYRREVILVPRGFRAFIPKG